MWSAPGLLWPGALAFLGCFGCGSGGSQSLFRLCGGRSTSGVRRARSRAGWGRSAGRAPEDRPRRLSGLARLVWPGHPRGGLHRVRPVKAGRRRANGARHPAAKSTRIQIDGCPRTYHRTLTCRRAMKDRSEQRERARGRRTARQGRLPIGRRELRPQPRVPQRSRGRGSREARRRREPFR